MRFKTTLLFIAIIVILGIGVVQGQDSGPTSTSSYTLEDIYNRLLSGTNGSKSIFTEPAAGPGATMHTLDEIMGIAPVTDNTNGARTTEVLSGKTFWGLTDGEWGLYTGTLSTIPAPVAKTGQTTCYNAFGTVISEEGTGQDGEYQKGVSSPDQRFTDNSDGTITDNLTGLIWLKNANCLGQRTWSDALTDCNSLANGSCSLTDGSSAGDWRLPNIKELQSMINYCYYNPTFSNTANTGQWTEGDPFSGIQSANYWTSTTYSLSTNDAWYVSMGYGISNAQSKTNSNNVWPVKGGN